MGFNGLDGLGAFWANFEAQNRKGTHWMTKRTADSAPHGEIGEGHGVADEVRAEDEVCVQSRQEVQKRLLVRSGDAVTQFKIFVHLRQLTYLKQQQCFEGKKKH